MSAPRFTLDLQDCPTPLGIAVSGGSDSLALLLKCVDDFPAENLRAVTVDHGLRPEAASEAQTVAGICGDLGVSHVTLSLALRPTSNVQAEARNARYDALAKWAAKTGVRAVAIGHTQDDVAETFLMRLARGSGVDGLAMMDAQFERAGARFVRPLLGQTREELRDYLAGKDQSWIEDPSNSDPRFDRIALRNARPKLDALGLTPQRLSDASAWMRAAQDALEIAADAWIAQNAFAEYGDAVFDLQALQNAPDETAFRVLSRALCNISGNPYRPRFSALEQIRSATALTLHGCLIFQHKSKLRITQELSAAKKTSGTRWVVDGPIAEGQTLRPLGEDGLRQIKDWRATALLPRRSLLASPSIWQGDRLVAAPLAEPDPRWRATASDPLHLPK